MAESSLPFVSCSFVFSSWYSVVARRWLPCLARILTLMTRDDRWRPASIRKSWIREIVPSRIEDTLHTYSSLAFEVIQLVKNYTFFICIRDIIIPLV